MSKRIFQIVGLAVLCLSFVSLGCKGSDGSSGISFPGPLPVAYTSADGVKGGSTYDTWWDTKALGSGTAPTSSVSSEFFRCSSCHGWDGMGISGAFADKTGLSTGDLTLPDVASINLRVSVLTRTPQQLFDLIKNVGGRPVVNIASSDHPDYTGVLTDIQMWNLVKFMREEWVTPSDLYDLTVTGILGPGAKTIAVTTITSVPTNTIADGSIVTGAASAASGLLISGGGGATFTLANVTGTFNNTENLTIGTTTLTRGSGTATINTSYVYKPTVAITNVGSKGDAARGDTIFAANCGLASPCHGPSGDNFPFDGGTFAGVGGMFRVEQDGIWVRMKFGTPASVMPQGIISKTSDLQDLYKALMDTKYP